MSKNDSDAGPIKRPFRITVPERCDLRVQTARTLDDAIASARWTLHIEEEKVAMIENRQTGYRWFVKSDYPRIELEPPDVIASTPLYVDLTLEEAVALERAAAGELPEDRRGAQLLEQAAARLRLEIDPVRRGLDPQPSLFERQIHFPKRRRGRKEQS